jgi:hypothetical protein
MRKVRDDVVIAAFYKIGPTHHSFRGQSGRRRRVISATAEL